MNAVSLKGVSNSGPSENLWANCPVGDIMARPGSGVYVYEEFVGNATAATNQNNVSLGTTGLKCFVSNNANHTITDAAIQNGGIVLNGDTADKSTTIAGRVAPLKLDLSEGKLWFEARLKLGSITDNDLNVFVGLSEVYSLTDILPITAANALGDKNQVGFFHVATDGDNWDTTYKADGVAAVNVGTDVKTTVAGTFIKLGMYFDGTVLSFYVDGVKLADTKTIPSADGTDFPNDVLLAPIVSLANMAGTAQTVTIDWIAYAQARVA